MADEQNKVETASPTARKSHLVPVLIVAALMGAEGVGVFMLARSLGGTPTIAGAAEGGDVADAAGTGEDGFSEVEIVECRPSNRMSGKLITLNVRVIALVSDAQLEHAQKLVRAKKARLEAGVNTVIRSAELKHLNEPQLKTISRDLKNELNRVLGDEGLIREVLLPQFLQSGDGV